MTDEEARRAIGEVLLQAFAARADAPPELQALLHRITAPPVPRARARRPSTRQRS